MSHINRRAELDQRPLDDFDGAVNAGTKSARLRQQNFLVTCHVDALKNLDEMNRAKSHSTYKIPIILTSNFNDCPANG